MYKFSIDKIIKYLTYKQLITHTKFIKNNLKLNLVVVIIINECDIYNNSW